VEEVQNGNASSKEDAAAEVDSAFQTNSEKSIKSRKEGVNQTESQLESISEVFSESEDPSHNAADNSTAILVQNDTSRPDIAERSEPKAIDHR